MAELESDGATIHYEVNGVGDDAVVFVHGHPFNRTMWARQAEFAVQKGWRSVLFDLRGYGASGKTTTPSFEFSQFSRDIQTLMDHLGISEAVLCGLSMGGQIVMDCCGRMPERVSGVVLAATAPQAETPESCAERLAMADRLEDEGMDPYAEDALPKMLARESIAEMPDVAAYVLEMMRRTDPAGAAAAQRARAGRPSYEPALSKLKCPALIVVGDQDAFTSRADANLMHDLVTGSDLLWLNGVGHMPNLERATEFNEAMGALLDRVSTRKEAVR
ncbi:MAG: alpha/beta hydrolase [Hyphomicrobiaceae bacterium]|nr:alpha/beta hydrolase [Hyphomicrobiaceae bacterium]